MTDSRPWTRLMGLGLGFGWGALALLGWGGCHESQPEPSTFRYHLLETPSSADPLLSRDVYSQGLADRLFDGLMRIDRVRGVPELEIAASFTISNDGRVYEFRLRPEARFENGRRILAADFEYSWERLLAPADDSPSRWLLEMVVGARDFAQGRAPSVAGIEVLAADRLRIRLDHAFAPFLYHLATPATSVVPWEEVERLGPSFGHNPVGSGPFRLVEWLPDHSLTLVPAANGTRTQPQVERLILEVVPDSRAALLLFRQQRLDAINLVPGGDLRGLQQEFSAEVRWFPSLSWQGLCFRTDRPPFDEVRVRRAVSLAIDRRSLEKQLGESALTLATGFLPPAVPGHDPSRSLPALDLDGARRLLAEAGFPQGRGFPSITFVSSASETQRQIAQAVTTAFAELGVPIQHQVVQLDTLLQFGIEGRLQVFSKGWLPEYPDPEPCLRSLFHSRGGTNETAYHDAEVDRWLDLARAEQEPTTRIELYRAAEARIVADAPCIPLVHNSEVLLLRQGWQGLPLGMGKRFPEVELVRWEPSP